MNKLFIALGILGFVFSIVFFSCSDESNKVSSKQAFIEMPVYGESFMEKQSTYRDGQNCCDCSNNSCSSKKCCTAPTNCTCTCTASYWTSSCTCSECTHIYYQLWLEPAQFEFWNELDEIFVDEGTAVAVLAQAELLNALDAIEEDDFSEFDSSKARMKSHCLNMSGTAISAINTLLTNNGFTDTL